MSLRFDALGALAEAASSAMKAMTAVVLAITSRPFF